MVVARTGSSKCPVTMLERYDAMASISKESKLRLFRGIVSTKSGERLRSQGSSSGWCDAGKSSYCVCQGRI